MTKHTPGPWQTDEAIVFVEGKEEDFAICHTQAKHTNTLPYETSLANARLIAAAPELLEAGEQLLYQLSINGDVQQAAQDLANVIAKAKGES